jgi:hypothetical protein
MTKKKDLKRRVRERLEKTGESYTAALARIRKRPEIEVVPDATREAEAAGLRCNAVVSKGLRAAGDLTPLFVRIRETLSALGSSLERRDAIHEATVLIEEARRFLAAVRAGARGLSRDERILALEWNGSVVVCGIVRLGRKPLLALGRLDDLKGLPPHLALMGIGR